MNNTVTILCSGFGLGFYVPGLLMERKFTALGIQAEIEVFESLMPDSKKKRTDDNRKAYQQSFAVALTSQKIPSDIRSSLDPAAVERLFRQWKQEQRQHFIVLSGHWVHVMDRYREIAGMPVYADLLYIDADLSPSWKNLRKLNPGYAEGYREVSMYDPAAREILYSIDAEPAEPLPAAARNGRLVVHGGGWGIGTFREKFDALESAGYELDIAAYSVQEIGQAVRGRRYYMNDPQWRTWQRDSNGKYTFPPFAEVTGTGAGSFPPSRNYQDGMYGVIRQASAVISKPGGGALIDSLASGTPLVLLDPFGPHEKINSDLWVELGYGIRYGDWAGSGYDYDELRKLSDNLRSARGQYPDYTSSYAELLSAAEGRR
ncbi:UDP-glucuronosyltransferase [Paenibacillus tritici]|uniref:UDP-glucuronosyltransferase n=1 Tax=Paenibacillus tritici TaxID=1873425 RepID=A0ABX2DNW4_9BACL|nr:UDP-glucuronosyltransferase [Paenibacillus tritici]NQX45126.1 UDP-glucuronosyltransferase [Paenibacillus tritici]